MSLSIGQVLLAGFIVLVGWSAMRALDVASKLYLRAFASTWRTISGAQARDAGARLSGGRRTAGRGLVTAAAALMTFESVRAYGVSLFASAGVAASSPAWLRGRC